MENAVKEILELWSSFVDVEIDENFTEEMIDIYITKELEDIYMKYNLVGDEKNKVIENVFRQRMGKNYLYLDPESSRTLMAELWS